MYMFFVFIIWLWLHKSACYENGCCCLSLADALFLCWLGRGCVCFASLAFEWRARPKIMYAARTDRPPYGGWPHWPFF